MDRHASGIGAVLTRTALLALTPLALLSGAAQAQDAANGSTLPAAITAEDYLAPPSVVREAVLAPRHENLSLRNLDPSGQRFLNTVSDGFPTLERFAKPHLNLGAFQVDPAANRSRRLTTRSSAGYEFISLDGQRRVSVEVPDGARVSQATWSPDGSQIAFFANFDDATRIYVADADDGDSEEVTDRPVLATFVSNVVWTDDGERLVTVLVPEDRGPAPQKPVVPETPMVRVTMEGQNKLRTYFDLLESPWEKRTVEYYGTGQLAVIDADDGDIHEVGDPTLIESFDISPDGTHFIVERIDKPFSYLVPVSSTGTIEELWDSEGRVITVLDESETSTGIRGGGNDDDDDDDEDERPERRGLTWRVDGPGMVYLQREEREERADSADEDEEEEEGQQRRSPRMDRVVYWHPPFGDDDTEIVYETEDRIGSVSFDRTARTLFLSRSSGGTTTLSAVFLDDPSQEYEIYEHDREDRLENPGSPMRTRTQNGESVIRTSPDGEYIYLSGTQYFEDPTQDAPRPFVDRVAIRTGEKERIFESGEDVYERISEVLDEAFTEVIVERESPTEIENSWRVNLVTGAEERLTNNIDYTPEITRARREIFMVARPDGFESEVRVTLPAGYREGTRLPAMFWFYPREYTDQEDYAEGLQRFNKNTFPGIGSRSMEILTLLGYAVVEPDLPIVGESGQMNDNYVQDLRNTLSAIIDTLDQRGWIDRGRLGLGGHSYGAFGTANAMVNTPFFKAGIAGDGNYNRTLTPVGFQSERRELWEADQIYMEMSPFFQADRMTGALLMYHGMEDHNVGTHPTHSPRLFHALNALGKTAGLYMYPYEDHGPATLETTLDLWARWTAWLEHYVKNHGQTSAVTTEADGSGGGSMR